ncbi:MAG: tRNA-intron lyase [archaeon]
MQKITAILIGNQITSNSSEAHTIFKKSHFGEKLGQKILYSICEAFYLHEQNKMQILDFKNSPIPENILLKKFQNLDKTFTTKYPVFKDLREKSYIVKTALKFGADFRVYEKGKTTTHSKWLCYATRENSSLKWQDFAAKNRVAHSTKKNLLIAIVDEENQISYYEIKWTQP